MSPMPSDAAVSAPAPVTATNNKISTLRDAVAIGVSTNPEYGVVAASRRATDEELNQGEALYLPSIDMNGDTGYEYSDDPGTRGGLDDDDTESMWRYEVGLTLTQMLFDGFETKYEVERQEARVASSANRVRETAELVGLCCQLLVAQRLQLRLKRIDLVDDLADRFHVAVVRRTEHGFHEGIEHMRGLRAFRNGFCDGMQARALARLLTIGYASEWAPIRRRGRCPSARSE